MQGIYVLIIRVSDNIHLTIGAIGEIEFPRGVYAYVGSAQNNLESRIKRHVSKKKRVFWHIDYLLSNKAADVTEVYCIGGGREKECEIARLLEVNAKPVDGFGCSDCRCRSHLFQGQDLFSWVAFTVIDGLL